MDDWMILSALLAVLLLASAFQAFELAGLKDGMARIQAPSAVLQPAAAPAQSPSAGGLSGLPNMVGGC
ncbi:hypothetical protein HYV43_00665 [Candidatus Micrarchaeota archaeon]|nr:hypothetical protein [Candidatus Micrarchaeota archaeon]